MCVILLSSKSEKNPTIYNICILRIAAININKLRQNPDFLAKSMSVIGNYLEFGLHRK